MERTYETGEHVIYVDKLGQPRQAVVTAWWQMGGEGEEKRGCNVVFVSGDPERDDTYGRQIERETSVVHKSDQAAPGNYWHWPGEV